MVETAKPIAARALERFSAIVAEGVDVHRCAAVRSLGRAAMSGASSVVQNALLDEDEDVRVDAVSALAAIGDLKSADAILENFLGDPSPDVKLLAIQTLADLGYQKIAPHLLKLVLGRDAAIVWDDSGYYDTGWDDWLDIQVASIKALGKLGVADAVPVIVQAIGDEEGQDVTQAAIPVLMQLGARGADALETLYRKGDARLRRRICAALPVRRTAGQEQLLAVCLADKSAEVRTVAVARLLKDDLNDPRLPDYFADSDPEIRLLLTKGLAARHPYRMTELLADKSPAVRQAAFKVIGSAPNKFDKEGFAQVVRKSIVGVPAVAGEAAIAWASLIGKPSARSLGEALLSNKQPLPFRLGLVRALTLLDEAGFPYLAKVAGDANRQLRISALTAIAEIAQNSALPNMASETLLAALRGDLVEPPAPETERDENAEADKADEAVADESTGQNNLADGDKLQRAGATAEKEATSTLEQLLTQGVRTEPSTQDAPPAEDVELTEKDQYFIELSKLRAMKKGKVALDVKVAPHQDVRRFAARLLGDLDAKDVAGELCQALQVDDKELRLSCLESLSLIAQRFGRLDAALAPAILNATRETDRNIRMIALRCCGYFDAENSDVEDRLLELADDRDVHVRLEAIGALGRGSGHDDWLVQALGDDYSGVRLMAARALAAKRLAMDNLIDLTLRFDGMHRRDVVELLKEWNAAEASEKYLKILQDDSRKRVWLVAIEALGDLLEHSQLEAGQAAA